MVVPEAGILPWYLGISIPNFQIQCGGVSVGGSSEEALAVLEDLTAWPVVAINCPAIQAAVGLVGQPKLSFWDALVVVAAARSGAPIYRGFK